MCVVVIYHIDTSKIDNSIDEDRKTVGDRSVRVSVSVYVAVRKKRSSVIDIRFSRKTSDQKMDKIHPIQHASVTSNGRLRAVTYANDVSST